MLLNIYTLFLAVVIAHLLTFCSPKEEESLTKEQPNVLLIFTDQQACEYDECCRQSVSQNAQHG